MYQFYSIFLFIFLLQGCVGIGVLTPETTNIEPQRKDSSYLYIADAKNGRYGFGYQQGINYLPQVLDKTLFKTKWGEPDTIKTVENEEIWTYTRDDFKWFGIVPMIIIPIPLAIPVGQAKVEVYFHQDLVSKLTVNDSKMKGFYIGPKHEGTSEVSLHSY